MVRGINYRVGAIRVPGSLFYGFHREISRRSDSVLCRKVKCWVLL